MPIISSVRATLNDWVPEKTRIVLGTAFDLVDWVTDFALTVSLVNTANTVPQLYSNEAFAVVNGSYAIEACSCAQGGGVGKDCIASCSFEALNFECVQKDGYTFTLCSSGGIHELSGLCCVALVLGTLGMMATIYLRKRELSLLLKSTREQSLLVSSNTFVERKNSASKVAPVDRRRRPSRADPEAVYRRLAALRARRSGKIATLTTLTFEDILMFVVNGILISNVETVDTLPLMVLATSICSSCIKIFIVSELPGTFRARECEVRRLQRAHAPRPYSPPALHSLTQACCARSRRRRSCSSTRSPRLVAVIFAAAPSSMARSAAALIVTWDWQRWCRTRHPTLMERIRSSWLSTSA